MSWALPNTFTKMTNNFKCVNIRFLGIHNNPRVNFLMCLQGWLFTRRMPTFKTKHFENKDACSSGHFGFQSVMAFLAPQFVLHYLGRKIEEKG